jgi:hypothetical protein
MFNSLFGIFKSIRDVLVDARKISLTVCWPKNELRFNGIKQHVAQYCEKVIKNEL